MGNYSRDTYELNKLKNYVGVRLQQGVPLVDADWNEMDDIRKAEIRSFLRNYVGDGVPSDSQDFSVAEAAVKQNDFAIGGGTQEQPGRCLADGWEALSYASVDYTGQALYENATLAAEWGVDQLPALAPPSSGERTDLVYLDMWEREVGSEDDTDLVNPVIGVETCTRLKREWTVRVAEGAADLPVAAVGHVFYPLAEILRNAGVDDINTLDITDRRLTGLGFAQMLTSFNQLQQQVTSGTSNAGNFHVTGNLGVGTPTPEWELEVDGTIVGETVLARTVRASRFLINGVELMNAAEAQAEIDALKAIVTDLENRITILEGN